MKNLHLRLTARCNKRCEHCFAHLDNKAPELGAKYWLGIIETAEKNGRIQYHPHRWRTIYLQ